MLNAEDEGDLLGCSDGSGSCWYGNSAAREYAAGCG